MSGERWGTEVYYLSELIEKIKEAYKDGEFPEELNGLVGTYIALMKEMYGVADTMNYYVSGDYGEDTLREVMQQELDKIEKTIREYRREIE